MAFVSDTSFKCTVVTGTCTMSLEASNNRIVCDSSDCPRDTRLPISLGFSESSANQNPRSSAAGWLFVRGEYEVRHYCPECRGKLVI
jgi:hypothetical protein